MIQSMTAVGCAQRTAGLLHISVELRTVNSRYLDLSVRLPQEFLALEEPIKALIPRWLSRGRVEIRVQIRGEATAGRACAINEEAAALALEHLQRLQQRLGLTGEIPLSVILGLPGVLAPAEIPADEATLWPTLSDCLECAMTELNAMRTREGKAMAADFTRRLDGLDETLKWVESQARDLVPLYRDRLQERIATMTAAAQTLDPARLAQEAAFLADRSDISEELLRSFSHIGQFRHIMAAAEPGGRQLNFLLQEMNRELNTMGSKAGSSAIAHRIVEMKSELEKIREQVQNVE